MEQMPIELLEVILELVDDKTLNISVPRVSKLFLSLSCADNDAIWRTKCRQKYLGTDPDSWPPIESYKAYYYKDKPSLFPLHGNTIGKTKLEQLAKVPGAGLGHLPRFVTINRVKFWCRNSDHFNMLWFVRNGSVLPKTWNEAGIKWDRTFDEIRQLLKDWNSNYRIKKSRYTQPEIDIWQISSIMKDLTTFLYQIEFTFHFTEGKSFDSREALSNIALSSCNELTSNDYERRYLNNKIEG